MKIIFDGLLAGERFLRIHGLELDEGTPDEEHWFIIQGLLTEVLRASGIALEMPDTLPNVPPSIASSGHQDTGLLLVCVAETGGVDCGSEFLVHRR